MSARYSKDARTLRVPTSVLCDLENLVREKKKIAAIKILRKETGCGLREAKEAIESTFEKRKIPSAFQIKPLLRIKSIQVDFGEGHVDVSLEELHMLTLVNMSNLGIDETRRILDLYDLLKAWEDTGDGRE